MEITQQQDPSLNPPVPADEPELDLYTIPSSSGWFSWEDIHETERQSLREFFDGSSITRTPKIYKEYRDFIISKYREDNSRRLTFSEVRKSLVGDVTLLQKVFNFLENWGLINYGAMAGEDLKVEEDDGGERWKVKIEEGAPHGVRVVAAPNSLKPVVVPPVSSSASDVGEMVESGLTLPPLASYTDVYIDKDVICRNCKDHCDFGHYKHTKEGSFVICVNCFKSGNYGVNKSMNDFQFIDYIPNSGNHGTFWTEAETLLLFESVLKHGDDWELVAQNVKTKSKLDCISKLIQLPFGELMIASAHGSSRFLDTDGNTSSVKERKLASSEPLETIRTEDYSHDHKGESELIGDDENQGPPLKRKCTELNGDDENQGPPLKRKCTELNGDDENQGSPLKRKCTELNRDDETQGPPLERKYTEAPSNAGSSLMKQVALISSMVDPRVTASAAEAAVTAICDEIQCMREIFDTDDNGVERVRSPSESIEKERALHVEDSEMEERHIELETEEKLPVKNDLPLTLRMRVATATTLGAAAAHAKLLADREEREIEHLVATTIDMQLIKLQRKMKHLEDLKLIMEKENTQIEELKESIVEEQINVLQRVFSSGLSRWRDHINTNVKSHMGSVV